MSLLETVTDLARRAGDITLEYFQTQLDVITKDDDSPVTMADRRTEEFLRSEITRMFPDDAILGEEYGDQSGRSGRLWIIDPIDGTRSFIHGVPIYGVMIGVENEGQVVAGAVSIPALKEIVAAEQGRGCWWNGTRAHVSSVDKLDEALLLTTDIANNYKYGRGKEWEAVSSRAGLVRTWGDCYGHLLVATGRAEVMLDPIMHVWDNAPLKVILEEAGGSFTDYSGKATIHAECVISANKHLAPEVLRIVSQAK